MSEVQEIGTIDVDAGIVMIGDPCYTLPDDGTARNDAARNWSRFCDALHSSVGGINVSPLGEGIAIVVESGQGDGSYPVYIEKNHLGQNTRLIIDFFPER